MSTATEPIKSEQAPPTRLYIAMHTARAAMTMVAKGGENKFDKYSYATLADYVEAIQKPLDDNGLIVVSHIDEINWLQDRETATGKFEKVCRIMLRTTVIHAESGEQLSVSVLGEGQDRADKAFYKADTGARKYALANLFNLATSDDPEVDSPLGDRPPQQRQQPQPPAEKQQQQAPVFTPPAGWPDTPIAELVKWTSGLASMSAFKTAFGMFTNEASLQTSLVEWERLVIAAAAKYKLLTDGFKKNRDAAAEQQIKTILEKIALDKQADDTFTPPAQES